MTAFFQSIKRCVFNHFRLFVKCGGYSYKKLLALAIQIASAILLA